jgi:methyl-accepting chemotaxis protein
MLFAQTNLPDWATQALLQFPVVAIVFVAVWWILGNVDRRYTRFMDRLDDVFRQFHELDERRSEQLGQIAQQLKEACEQAIQDSRKTYEALLKDMQSRHQSELERLAKVYDGHIRSKNAEIRRLSDLLPNRPATNEGE